MEKIENEAQEEPEVVSVDLPTKTSDSSTAAEFQNSLVETTMKDTKNEAASTEAEVKEDEAQASSTKSDGVKISSSDNVTQRIAYFRLGDMGGNKGGELSFVPRIGDVVEFELAKDKVLSKFVFAQNIVLKKKVVFWMILGLSMQQKKKIWIH